MSKSKHEFAFFQKNISLITKPLSINDQLFIEDETLYHRIAHVLRLRPQEHFVLFDRLQNILVKLVGIEKKKKIITTILKKENNKTIKPDITVLLPLLKKDNFESALYALAELGVQSIQPIITQKSQKKWNKKLADSRYLHILTGAAEQSKHFAFPMLHDPIELSHYIKNHKQSCPLIYFDPDGDTILETIQKIDRKKIKKLVLMVGPEGDLTPEEKKMIKQKNSVFCKLTPTILRAFQAVTVGVGAFRSLL